ncbi:MAG: 3-deoxy-D-manno-octulosonic acid transferase [Gammaproteobacteria bacterium RIFCSPLOWO2_02_FULL_38_11]|nr:MAG: 3-deoxy-D-manno-octulosonic acid transferase [Gammaproteobacteria bacterium RIFCSPHIGHO2_12_38_15]OGT68186.1 MAG: 3-deoxy-D-manno-octulosonic acid transferase [Gammaproteobacteria bacterium RIFCSPLOWO2_02_FULL_38_11]OGT77469.1 MAG: 3-deoxy-D-manno-octulosonic acid transferase [Gammaproteobacteria bacterium RIFCSPLOWO2_12_FULL_38_14]
MVNLRLRHVYTLLLYLIFPFIWLRLLWRAKKAPAYKQHWKERIGLLPFQLNQKSIWIHAASLGEANAATPVIRFLQMHYKMPLVLTAMTPTGRQRLSHLKNENTFICYVPYDYPFAIKNFLKHTCVSLMISMETEIWPNIITFCEKNKIPFVLLNARMSEKSKSGYMRFSELTAPLFKKMNCVMAQTKEDAERFIALGVNKERIHITGSLKFDLNLPSDLFEKSKIFREKIGDRQVLLAASTHEGEDNIILKNFIELRKEFPHLLLILVPRHPERFDAVFKLCEKTKLEVKRRSQSMLQETTAIYVGDTLGELLLMYAVSDLAFVGGSLIPHGGQNPLEAAALGVPIVMGPHFFNFSEIVKLLKNAGALKVITENQLMQTVSDFLKNEQDRKIAGLAGKQVLEKNKGALQRQIDFLLPWIKV